jgi:hypothetical protein
MWQALSVVMNNSCHMLLGGFDPLPSRGCFQHCTSPSRWEWVTLLHKDDTSSPRTSATPHPQFYFMWIGNKLEPCHGNGFEVRSDPLRVVSRNNKNWPPLELKASILPMLICLPGPKKASFQPKSMSSGGFEPPPFPPWVENAERQVGMSRTTPRRRYKLTP